VTLVWWLVAIWLILSGLLTWGISHWFRWLRGDFDGD